MSNDQSSGSKLRFPQDYNYWYLGLICPAPHLYERRRRIPPPWSLPSCFHRVTHDLFCALSHTQPSVTLLGYKVTEYDSRGSNTNNQSLTLSSPSTSHELNPEDNLVIVFHNLQGLQCWRPIHNWTSTKQLYRLCTNSHYVFLFISLRITNHSKINMWLEKDKVCFSWE